MSGGHFDYVQHQFESDVAEPLQKEIAHNKIPAEWEGDWSGQRWTDETIAEFRNGLEALRRAYVYVQRIDWLLSGDDSEEEFHRRLKDDLQNFRFPEYHERDGDDND